MDLAQRIAQFENMCQADPENEMAHFSLGNAYAQAGRHADAAASFLRCTAIAPGMSKAFQLAAESLLKAGDREGAAEAALTGYRAASERGDLMPKRALGELLGTLGIETPAEDPAASGAVAAAGGDGFVCARTGQPGTRMTRPPFRGPVGAWIQANIAQETFDAWIRQGTKVINELRLDLSQDRDAETYDAQMREYLGIDDELYQALRSS